MTRIVKQSRKDILEQQSNQKIEREIQKLRKEGLLPPVGTVMTEEQKQLYVKVRKGETIEPIEPPRPDQTISQELRMWKEFKIASDFSNENFNLTVDDIILPKYCAYLGVELSYNDKDYQKSNYAVTDRIDNKKGFDKDNILIISKQAKVIKNLCGSQEQFVILAQNILKIHQK